MINSLLDSAQSYLQSYLWIQVLANLALKSAIVLLAAVAVSLALRRASAATRHLVWAIAIGSLLVMPVLTAVLPDWKLPIMPQIVPSQPIQALRDASADLTIADRAVIKEDASQVVPLRAESETANSPLPTESQKSSLDSSFSRTVSSVRWVNLLLPLWMIGMLFVLGRLALAAIRVRRFARNSDYLIDYGWTVAAKRLEAQIGLPRHVALLRSPYVTTPMACGILDPVVLLPEEADEWSEEWKQIVLLHELAHIKRHDCLTQMLASVVCALYWFNPLVWWAARRLRAEREMACDDHVLEVGTKPSDYAGNLVEIAKSLGAVNPFAPAAVGMACSQLESRVRAILDPDAKRQRTSRQMAFLLTVGVACLIVPLAMARPWHRVEASMKGAFAERGVDSQPNLNQILKETTETAVSRLQHEHGQAPSRTQKSDANDSEIDLSGEVSEDDQDNGTGSGRGIGQGAGGGSGQGQGTGQGSGQSTELTADQIIQMRTHNVTPEFIESIRKQGFENVSVRQLVELRVHDINEEFIKQARGWGDGNISIRELVQLKISGVTPEFINAMKQTGYDKLTIKELSNLKMFDVSPEFIAALRRLGYDNVPANKLTELKIHGITEDFIKEMQNWTGGKPTVNELVQMKIHGVTPAFANQMKALGFENLSINKLTELKIHGITEDFIRQVQNWTGGKPTINELLQVKIHGITPEFANQMKALGFENLSINKLTELKIHGVSEEFIKEMRSLGFDKLTPQQVLQMRIHGVDADYVKKLRAAGLKNISVNQMIDLKIRGIDSILLKENR